MEAIMTVFYVQEFMYKYSPLLILFLQIFCTAVFWLVQGKWRVEEITERSASSLQQWGRTETAIG